MRIGTAQKREGVVAGDRVREVGVRGEPEFHERDFFRLALVRLGHGIVLGEKAGGPVYGVKRARVDQAFESATISAS